MADVTGTGAPRPAGRSRPVTGEAVTGPASGADRPSNAGFGVTPFARLARTHALSTAGDAMVATALAGTIFFEGATSDARGRVFLYLLLTMAPFVVVAPLIGPALDRARSGRRWMIIGSLALRGAICFFMIDDVDSLLFYPEAFAVLVLQKGYAVARSAMVPATVHDDAELVEANSKLSLLSGIMGFVGAAPAALLFKIGGPGWALGLAMVTFVVGAVVGVKLTHRPVADEPAGEAERAELRSAGVLLAASAMGLLRGIVGFLTLLLAFDFRRAGVPAWQFVVVAGLSVLGALVGSLIAPRLRRLVTEERILIGVLVAIVASGAVAAIAGGFRGAALLGAVVGIGSTTGKLAFDSIVQRDAPDANRGRSFARFETRFQVIWVLGAMMGLIVMPAWVGFVVVTVVAAVAAFSYAVGMLAWKHRSGTRTPFTERALVIDERMSEVGEAARLRLLRPFDPLRARWRARLPRRHTGLGAALPTPPVGPPAEEAGPDAATEPVDRAASDEDRPAPVAPPAPFGPFPPEPPPGTVPFDQEARVEPPESAAPAAPDPTGPDRDRLDDEVRWGAGLGPFPPPPDAVPVGPDDPTMPGSGAVPADDPTEGAPAHASPGEHGRR